MRNGLLITIFGILLTHTAVGQEIQFKKRTKDGGTIVATTPIRIHQNWQPTVEYSLIELHHPVENTKAEPSNRYAVILNILTAKDALRFTTGMKLFISTGSEETMVLESDLDNAIKEYTSIGSSGYSYTLGSYRTIEGRYYLYAIQYPITLGQLETLAKEGITRLRIQTSANNIDCIYTEENTTRIREYYSKAIQLIVESLDPYLTF